MIKHNDDDDFDENGVLRDGHSVRVPMMMRDGMTPLQRAVAQHSLAMRLHDGRGGPIGHKPGFVYSTDASLNDAKERAYAAYDAELRDAYKHPQGWRGDIDANDEAHVLEISRRLVASPPTPAIRSQSSAFARDRKTSGFERLGGGRTRVRTWDPLIKSHQITLIYQAHFDISSVRSGIEPERKLENVETRIEQRSITNSRCHPCPTRCRTLSGPP